MFLNFRFYHVIYWKNIFFQMKRIVSTLLFAFATPLVIAKDLTIKNNGTQFDKAQLSVIETIVKQSIKEDGFDIVQTGKKLEYISESGKRCSFDLMNENDTKFSKFNCH